MVKFRFLSVAVLTALSLSAEAANAASPLAGEAGAPPDCPYGYYDHAPYSCAPYGYYGPEWFAKGAFIGAGPWFHGPKTFHGHVDNHFDEHHGYKGPAPSPGDKPEPGKPLDKIAHFNGNEVRDGRGHQSAQLKH
ncbi:MAG: hypothetical protein ABR987_17720 [Terracidiphilus sp.]|jgi:hypothetical protein